MRLLARYYGEQRESVEAQIVGFTAQVLRIESVLVGGSRHTEEIDLSEESVELHALRESLLALLRSARVRAGTDIPLTRIEREIVHTSAFSTYLTHVSGIRVLPNRGRHHADVCRITNRHRRTQ